MLNIRCYSTVHHISYIFNGMIILYALLMGIIGGLLNRIRGGWSKHMGDDFMSSLTHGTRRIILALFSTSCLYIPFWMERSFNSIDYLWFLGAFLAAFLIGLLPGWGSWFFVGRDEDSYKHNQDWIVSELLVKWIYGPKDSIKRKIFKWRRSRELFAMNIRGLNFTVFAPLVYGLHMYFEYDYKLYYIALLMPTGIIMGHLYEVGFKIDMSKFPNFMKSTTELGEVLTGSTLMSSFLLIGSYVALMFK